MRYLIESRNIARQVQAGLIQTYKVSEIEAGL